MKRSSKDKDVFDTDSDSDFVEIVAVVESTKKKSIGKNEIAKTKPTLPIEKTESAVVCPAYILEIAKSGRAECKRCGEKIGAKLPRVGIMIEGDWGLLTRCASVFLYHLF
jgi:hypothetical protein